MIIPIAVLALLTVPAYAGEYSYKCTIQEVWTVDDAGRLRHPIGDAPKSFVGETFVVDRRTGATVGLNAVSNSLASQILILREGSTSNSFTVLSVFERAKEATHLEIKEFMKGSSKPFLHLGFWGVITGICI